MAKSAAMLVLPVLVMWCFCSFSFVGALWFNIPSSGTKCVSEEMHSNVVVLADYAVIYDDLSGGDVATVTSKITSPYGNTLHTQNNVTSGHFAFTTRETGTYVACFSIDSHLKNSGASMNLEWKTGIAAKDWDSVAKKENIEGVELELMKLEMAVESIHESLIYLKSKEAEMRKVSEKTNGRVAWFSILSLGVCIVVSILQLWHLKNFFHMKKLI